MRVAVALPSLAPGAPLRDALDAVVVALGERGVEVEAFAEMERVRQGAPVPIYHYLRFPERHAARSFDRGLWPVGRDARPWEPAWILSRRLPGVVWVLDGPLHHLVLGSVAMTGHWRQYGRLLAGRFGEDAGRALSLFAAGWGSRASCRRLDPVPALLHEQAAVLAADQRVAAEIEGARGPAATVVPLPIAVPEAIPPAPSEPLRAMIVSVDVVQPRRLLEGIAGVLESHPALELRIGVPEPTYHVRLAPAAHAAGIFDRVDWILSPGPDTLAREVERSAVVLLLDVDVAAADRALLESALRLGRPVISLDVPAFRDIPSPPLTKLRPGHAVGAGLAVALDALLQQEDLRAGLAAAGRGWASSGRDAGTVSELLLERLREAPPLRTAAAGDRSAAWPSVRDGLLEHGVPAAASSPTRHLVEEIVGSVLPGGDTEEPERR